jgi:hypothetical protein
MADTAATAIVVMTMAARETLRIARSFPRTRVVLREREWTAWSPEGQILRVFV